MSNTSPWFFWAVLSAVFAVLTAIFAKIGVKRVDSDLATLVSDTTPMSRDMD
jgi:transporter family protein